MDFFRSLFSDAHGETPYPLGPEGTPSSSGRALRAGRGAGGIPCAKKSFE